MADKLAAKDAATKLKEEKGAASAAKKGAAKEKAVKKRPAAHADVKIPDNIMKIDMTDVFDRLRKRRKEMTYSQFTNNASDNGFRRARARGVEHNVYRAFGAVQYGKAKTVWEKTE